MALFGQRIYSERNVGGETWTRRELCGGVILDGDGCNRTISSKLSRTVLNEEVSGTFDGRAVGGGGSLTSALLAFKMVHFQCITIIIIPILRKSSVSLCAGEICGY